MRLQTTAAWVALLSAQLVETGGMAAARQRPQSESAATAEESPGAGPAEGPESTEDWLERAVDAYGRGEMGLAAEAFSRAGERARSANDEDAAASAFNNASVLWNEVGRYEAALEAARAAVELRTGGTDAATARALNSLGLSLLNLGRYDESAVELRRALVLNRDLGEAEGEVVNLTNLAIAAERRGDFHAASRELSSALAVLERWGAEPWAAERRTAALLNLGVLRERLGDYRGALGVLAPLEATAAAGGAPRERAVLEQNLAVVYRNLGDPLEALARLERAEQLYRSAGDEAGAAGVLLNVGIVRYVDLEDAGAALPPLEAARELSAALGERGLEAEASFHLGRAHTFAGDDVAARRELERSFEVASAAGAGEVRWQARWGLALLDERAGDLDAALDELRSALDEVDAVRASLREAGERGTYFADKRVVYAAAARVLLRLADAGRAGAAEEALQVMWRAKARLLLDALGSGAAGAGSVDEAAKAPPAVGAVQADLGDELLLEYLLAGDRLFRMRVDARQVVVEDRGDAATVLRDVRLVHESLAGGAPPPPDAMARLSRALLEGAWSAAEPRKRVAIAGDGLLRYLPFELLETMPAGPPLVEEATVRYLPSGAFAVASARASDAPTTLRAYALSELASSAGTPIEIETSDVFAFQVLRRLPMLRAAEAEVRLAAAALGGRAQVRTGDEASETNFRRDAADRARVLHLATHAVLSEDRGGAAALVLRADGEHDGLLRAAELAELRLDVDLALLSACSTTFGAADDARALESLSGAFLRAGARGVVATLWDVADEDAAAFVEAFAWELGRGRDAAEALRRVKRRFRNDPRWSSPTHWAGFVLIGASPVVRPAARWRRALLPAALVAIAVAVATLLAARRAQGQSRKVSKSSNGAD